MTLTAKHNGKDPAISDIAPSLRSAAIPRWLRGIILLSRWDRPVGIWLLLWPALWGLLLAFAGTPPLAYVLYFVLGSILMRGAGCTINDILDRDLDGAVARTALRPLPAGVISVTAAWVWLAIQLLLALALLLLLPQAAWVWALLAVPLVMLYPAMKRITWWPQLWLGITFNWGLLVGFAVSASPDYTTAFWFYAGAIFWTLGYDTIYATQDAADDALLGVRSTARLFKDKVRGAVAVCYFMAGLCWLGGSIKAGLGPASLFGFAAAFMFFVQQFQCWHGGAEGARRAFLLNIRVGAAVALGLWLGYAF